MEQTQYTTDTVHFRVNGSLNNAMEEMMEYYGFKYRSALITKALWALYKTDYLPKVQGEDNGS